MRIDEETYEQWQAREKRRQTYMLAEATWFSLCIVVGLIIACIIWMIWL